MMLPGMNFLMHSIRIIALDSHYLVGIRYLIGAVKSQLELLESFGEDMDSERRQFGYIQGLRWMI